MGKKSTAFIAGAEQGELGGLCSKDPYSVGREELLKAVFGVRIAGCMTSSDWLGVR